MAERELDGKKVVVIGGTKGIGYATAEMALAWGADVVVASRSAENVANAGEALAASAGRPVTAEQLDGMDRAATADFLARHAPFDHLALPGSEVIRMSMEDLDEGKARAYFDSKFWGPFWAAYQARTHIRRGGSITFYSGVANRRPIEGYTMGGAVDGAIDAMTRSLAWEFHEAGIRVNCVSPGIIDTGIGQAIRTAEEWAAWERYNSERQPVRRLGHPEECARAGLYLMTNGFVTGEILAVDGGVESIP
ncbi:MAG: SDR family oxidoreductase [Rhodospirillaceae bacterium]|nr:SDR family oxidoreductase [Rhodospirillaceae bacterium]